MTMDADVIVVGAGLAGLVAATEVADAGKRVIIVDQESEQNLGGQAFWSLGGLFLVDTPEQRRLRHSRLATIWRCRTGWAPPVSTARRTIGRASGPRPTSPSPPARSAPGCTRRACAGSPSSAGPSAAATAHRPRQFGAALPRHLGHRAGRGRAVRAARLREAEKRAWSRFNSAIGSTQLIDDRRRRRRRRGAILEPSDGRARRADLRGVGRRVRVRRPGRDRRRRAASAAIRAGPPELARAPRHAAGVHGAGRARPCRRPDARHRRGGRRRVINRDRMWHYTEGLQNWNPIWQQPRHPHPARAFVAVVRRTRQAPAGAAVSRLRHARHARRTS